MWPDQEVEDYRSPAELALQAVGIELGLLLIGPHARRRGRTGKDIEQLTHRSQCADLQHREVAVYGAVAERDDYPRLADTASPRSA